MTAHTKERILYNHMRRKMQLKTKVRIPLYHPAAHYNLIFRLAAFAAKVAVIATQHRMHDDNRRGNEPD